MRNGDATAVAAATAVVFADFAEAAGARTYTISMPAPAAYVPGQFHRRELPRVMAILAAIEEDIDTVVVDGYVDLGGRPGLGRHLWEALGAKKTMIGVAKTYFQGSQAVRVMRPGSRRPSVLPGGRADCRARQ